MYSLKSWCVRKEKWCQKVGKCMFLVGFEKIRPFGTFCKLDWIAAKRWKAIVCWAQSYIFSKESTIRRQSLCWSCQIEGKGGEKPKTKEQSLLQNESRSGGSAGGTHHSLPRHATAAVWEKDQSRVFPLKNFSSQNNNVLKYFTWKRGDKPVQTKTSSCFTFIKLFNPGP